MSGGHFDYDQYKIGQIAEKIESLIEKNGKLKTREELVDEGWDSDFYERYPEQLRHHEYSEEVINEFKKGLVILKTASVYAQRIDWLVSGDDSEESFHERLKEDLEALNILDNLRD